MCAKHKHEAVALDRFLTKACGPCMVEKPFDSGVIQTERFRYLVERGRKRLVKKHWDVSRQW
jgi:hypothetical protein